MNGHREQVALKIRMQDIAGEQLTDRESQEKEEKRKETTQKKTVSRSRQAEGPLAGNAQSHQIGSRR